MRDLQMLFNKSYRIFLRMKITDNTYLKDLEPTCYSFFKRFSFPNTERHNHINQQNMQVAELKWTKSKMSIWI